MHTTASFRWSNREESRASRRQRPRQADRWAAGHSCDLTRGSSQSKGVDDQVDDHDDGREADDDALDQSAGRV